MSSTWTGSAWRGAVVATGVASVIALSAGGVRIFPWLLDPSVTWRVAAPFARSLGVVATETALAVGWPLGWAFATLAFVERGEARVLRLLGERPARTVARLGAQGLILAGALAALSWASALQSTEPGRIVTELIADGEVACAKAETPRTYTVPFFGATWLCVPGVAPRLVGQGPGPLSAVVFSAKGARASGDLGTIDLDDAQIALPHASLHIDALHIRGTAPWGHASTIAPSDRALALSAAVALCALASVALVLVRRVTGRVATFALGASGSVAALGLLRIVERFGASRSWLVLTVAPLALAATLLVGWGAERLPRVWQAASK
jgi:hypothetical protein